MTADIVVRAMGVGDLHEVHRIDRMVYPEPWSLTLWKQELDRPRDRIYLVACRGSVVVGHAGMLLILDEGHVSTVAVDPDHQHVGIATRLLLELLAAAVASGVGAFTLEVRVSNIRAQRLYQRFGFAPSGIRKNYYADTNEDALIMWAPAVDTPAYAARLTAIANELDAATGAALGSGGCP